MRLRFLIASQLPSYELNWEVEADESYFGGIRKGKRGRGATGKVAVFSSLKRGRKVFTVIVPNARTETLLPIIQERVIPDSIVFTDTFKAYNALHVTEFHHMLINHFKLFADRRNHIKRDLKLLKPSQTTSEKIQWHQTEQFSLVFLRSANSALMGTTIKTSISNLNTGIPSQSINPWLLQPLKYLLIILCCNLLMKYLTEDNIFLFDIGRIIFSTR